MLDLCTTHWIEVRSYYLEMYIHQPHSVSFKNCYRRGQEQNYADSAQCTASEIRLQSGYQRREQLGITM